MEIYAKNVTINQAGQKAITFSKSSTIKCFFQANSSERRVAPYIDNIDYYQFYISNLDSQYITYNNRIYNIRDRNGNLIDAGPFEITNIEKKAGFTGKIHHLFITAKSVVENV
jgi:hypothetical protein